LKIGFKLPFQLAVGMEDVSQPLLKKFGGVRREFGSKTVFSTPQTQSRQRSSSKLDLFNLFPNQGHAAPIPVGVNLLKDSLIQEKPAAEPRLSIS